MGPVLSIFQGLSGGLNLRLGSLTALVGLTAWEAWGLQRKKKKKGKSLVQRTPLCRENFTAQISLLGEKRGKEHASSEWSGSPEDCPRQWYLPGEPAYIECAVAVQNKEKRGGLQLCSQLTGSNEDRYQRVEGPGNRFL